MTHRTRMRFAISSAWLAVVTGASIAPSYADGALAVGLPARGPSGGFVFGVATDDPNAQTVAMNPCKGIDTENNQIPDRDVGQFCDGKAK
jgi:hypothetical protein